MTRGEQVFLKGKNGKPIPVEFIVDYRQDPETPYPAIRIRHGSDDRIVKPEDIFTPEELRDYQQKKEQNMKRWAMKAWKNGVDDHE